MADPLSDLTDIAADLPLPPKIENDITELEKLVSEFVDNDIENFDHWMKIRDLAQEVANQLRDLRFRQSVGSKTQIFPYIIQTINKVIANRPKVKANEMNTPVLAVTQLLRIVGNLVHTSDDNRQKCLQAGGAPALKSLLDMFVDMARVDGICFEEEIKINLIVATNFSVDFQPAQDLLAELGLTASLSALIEYAYSKRLVWMSFPLILLDEMCGIEAGWSQIPDTLLCTLAQMIVYYSLQDQDDEDNDKSDPPKEESLNANIVMLCSQLLETLVHHASPERFISWLFVSADPGPFSFSDDPPTPMWCRLLMFLRIGHHSIEAAPGTYQGEIKYNIYSMVKTLIIQALVLAMAHVDVPPEGKRMMFEIMSDWAREDAIIKNRVDLVIMCGLWLSNLASDEEGCRMLVEDYQILESLVNILKIWTPSRLGLPEDSTLCKAKRQQAQILHGWCGLARNLAVADAYKTKLGELGIVDYALECLRPEFDIVEPLNGTAAALLRHLCRNHPKNAQRILESNRVDFIVNLAKRVEQPFFILETSRLVSVLINTVAQMETTSQSEEFASGWMVLYSEITVDALARFTFFAPDLVHCMCSSLLKIRDPEEPSASSAQSGSGDRQDKVEICRTALDALLCLSIPVKENGTEASDKKSEKVAQQAPNEGDEQAKKVDTVDGELEGDEDEAELPEEVKKLIKQIPIQMKQNLMVALTQLGEQVMKSPPNPSTNENSNGRADVERIRDILMKHYKTHHLKEAPASDPIKKFESLDGDDQQDEAKPLSLFSMY
ncbi:hypothetical protein PCASD_24859 [Puccinia coronata f. sp. avenae]|uniref:Uncharacterized protein n=1 Tax=Puccinia coronata f. sp. avenae TaxID=200324 RepID=A0A2N5S5P2_9BASI|nr:hypothetical protein PCASD_24859 [Puccinia coronata f. sp. avenae]